MSSRPEWDAFLLDTGPPESSSSSWSWGWRWRPSSLWLPSPAALWSVAWTLPFDGVLAVATVLVPVLAPAVVWLSLAYLRTRAEATLKAMRRFLSGAKSRMWDMQYDPKFRQCLRALRRNEREFAEVLKACDRLPGQHACKRICKQALGCGSGDVAGGGLTEPSDSELTMLSDAATTDACCGGVATAPGNGGGAALETLAAQQRIAEEQGDWYSGAAHGMCLQYVEDSSSEDAAGGAEAARQARDAREEQQLWRQLYAEERRRNRPR